MLKYSRIFFYFIDNFVKILVFPLKKNIFSCFIYFYYILNFIYLYLFIANIGVYFYLISFKFLTHFYNYLKNNIFFFCFVLFNKNFHLKEIKYLYNK